jgi:hypothetical protein
LIGPSRQSPGHLRFRRFIRGRRATVEGRLAGQSVGAFCLLPPDPSPIAGESRQLQTSICEAAIDGYLPAVLSLHPLAIGRHPCILQRICPDAWDLGLGDSDCACSRLGLSRLVGDRWRSTHSLLSLSTKPASQLILTQLSPLALELCSQMSGQTRADLLFTASSASMLATFTSSFIPACLLNRSSDFRAAEFQLRVLFCYSSAHELAGATGTRRFPRP